MSCTNDYYFYKLLDDMYMTLMTAHCVAKLGKINNKKYYHFNHVGLHNFLLGYVELRVIINKIIPRLWKSEISQYRTP